MMNMTQLRRWQRMQHQRETAIINDVARLANELTAKFPNMTRTDALKEADRLVSKYGIGVSLAD